MKLTFCQGGIGPADQLEVVAKSKSDGKNFIDSSEWIELPVGHNLVDHTNVSPLHTRARPFRLR